MDPQENSELVESHGAMIRESVFISSPIENNFVLATHRPKLRAIGDRSDFSMVPNQRKLAESQMSRL